MNRTFISHFSGLVEGIVYTTILYVVTPLVRVLLRTIFDFIMYGIKWFIGETMRALSLSLNLDQAHNIFP